MSLSVVRKHGRADTGGRAEACGGNKKPTPFGVGSESFAFKGLNVPLCAPSVVAVIAEENAFLVDALSVVLACTYWCKVPVITHDLVALVAHFGLCHSCLSDGYFGFTVFACSRTYQKGVATCNLYLCEVGHRSERPVRVGSPSGDQATCDGASRRRHTAIFRPRTRFQPNSPDPPKVPTGLALVISDGGGRPPHITTFQSSPFSISVNASRSAFLLATASTMKFIRSSARASSSSHGGSLSMPFSKS